MSPQVIRVFSFRSEFLLSRCNGDDTQIDTYERTKERKNERTQIGTQIGTQCGEMLSKPDSEQSTR